MKKIRVTRKDLTKPLACGYCDIQFIARLLNLSPFGYNSGVYGWNYDVYNFEGYDITTGYRGMVGNYFNYTKLNKLNEKARTISEKYYFTKEEEKAYKAAKKRLYNDF